MPVPPPPPPPGPPPPPALPAFGNSKSSKGAVDPNARNQLLSSIRHGTKLKKTPVINDRSAPLLDGNRNKAGAIGGSSPSLSSGGSSISSGKSNGLNVPPGLGDLFAGGIPKLKPVGLPKKADVPNSNIKVSPNLASGYSPSNQNSPSNISHSVTVSVAMKSNSTSLGNKPAPPPPPPSNLKPSQANSNVSARITNIDSEKRTTNFGKPSVAPKPPGINSLGPKPAKPNPPPKLPNLYIPPAPSNSPQVNSPAYSSNATPTPPPPPTPPSAGVSRAQSMRMPKSASPSGSSISLESKTIGRATGRDIGAIHAQSQPPPPPRIINGNSRGRPSLKPPATRPPPPPNKTPPNHPPPPPPMSAPPPPPHRTAPAPTPVHARVNGNLCAVPSMAQNGAPPPPPTRNSSMRSVTSTTSVTSTASSSGSSSSSLIYSGNDLESRFGHLFQAIDVLPAPTQFRGSVKTYPSKNAQSTKRQPAPPPPTTQMQLGTKLWPNNTSSC